MNGAVPPYGQIKAVTGCGDSRARNMWKVANVYTRKYLRDQTTIRGTSPESPPRSRSQSPIGESSATPKRRPSPEVGDRSLHNFRGPDRTQILPPRTQDDTNTQAASSSEGLLPKRPMSQPPENTLKKQQDEHTRTKRNRMTPANEPKERRPKKFKTHGRE